MVRLISPAFALRLAAAGRSGRWPVVMAGVLLIFVMARADATEPESLADGGSAVVAEVLDGATLRLVDGRALRLAGLLAPQVAPPAAPARRTGRRSAEPPAPEALAAAARATLAALVRGRTVRLRQGGTRTDRYGRVLAHLVREDGLWIEGELLRQGLARVWTVPDNRALAAEMLAQEDDARRAGRGLWRLPAFAVRSPDQVQRDADSFQIVEGQVLTVAARQGWVYLNFGPDWRTDFTVAVASRHRRAFAAAGLDLATLAGARIRVRGWVTRRNGAMIEANHPEQIERISATH